MLAAAAALVLATTNAAPVRETRPAVALLPLRALGLAPEVAAALQVTLRNEVSALPEARLVPGKELDEHLKREPDCEARIACAAQAASRTGARQLIVGTVSQLGDSFMIDLKLLDARNLQELRRATHPVSGSQDALIQSLRETAVQLLAPSRFVGGMKIDVPGFPGALLFVDGKAAGTAPLAVPIEGLAPGPHTVRVVAPGKAEETSAFVDVRYGETTAARIELQPLRAAVPVAALPGAQATNHKSWVRPAAYAGLGLGVASLATAIVFHSKAYSLASDLNHRESLNQLDSGDAARYGEVNRDTNLARGFYVASALLTAAGAGLLYWDLHPGFRF